MTGSERETKKHERQRRGKRVKREMDGLGARPGLTVVLVDVTRPRQGE